LLADSARSLWLVLRCVGSSQQGQVEGPAAHVAAVHVQRAARVPRSVACFTKVTEALRHAGR
jgi:hypothetical protein